MRLLTLFPLILASLPLSHAAAQGAPDPAFAPAPVQQVLQDFAAAPKTDLSRYFTMFVPVTENPGPQRDINARRIASKERSPVDTTYDSLQQFLQTLPNGDRGSALFAALSAPGAARDVSLFGSQEDGWVALRGWQIHDKIMMSVLNLSADLSSAQLATLEFPLGAKAYWAGDDVTTHVPNNIYVAKASDGDLLLSLDTLNRCSGDRRLGVVLRLASDMTRLEWVSPLRVAGGRHFAMTDKSLFAIDGGSCEKDYLYELDLDSGKVKTRQVVPSAQDAGDFTALNGNDLYLVLYNRFIHYQLR